MRMAARLVTKKLNRGTLAGASAGSDATSAGAASGAAGVAMTPTAPGPASVCALPPVAVSPEPPLPLVSPELAGTPAVGAPGPGALLEQATRNVAPRSP